VQNHPWKKKRITLGILASGIQFFVFVRKISSYCKKKIPFLQSGFEDKSQLTLKLFSQ